MVELLVVLAIVGVVSAFAMSRMARAQQSVRAQNTTREFLSHVEKARVDSMRRNVTTPAQMARVTITSDRTYTVTMDFDKDGRITTNAAGEATEVRTVTVPPENGAITATIPTTIRFNRLGRPVNDAGSPATVPTFNVRNMSSGYSSGYAGTTATGQSTGNSNDSVINITALGDTAVNANATLLAPTAPSVSTAGAPATRSYTTVTSSYTSYY